MRGLVPHFKAAPTSEACRNLLAVMLDHISHHLLQVSHLEVLTHPTLRVQCCDSRPANCYLVSMG